MAPVLIVACILPLVAIALALAALRLRVSRARRGSHRTLGFLHPYCNDGGGGERVLWVALRDLVSRQAADGWRIVVYTGDRATDDEIRAHAASRFGVHVPPTVEFVRLSLRGWIEAKRYPVATLIFQAVGSAVLAAEAVWRAPPEVLVDTTGLAFCFPLLRVAGVRRLGAYVHYPIISSDMLAAVSSRRAAHNNAGRLAGSAVGTALKLVYYHLLTAAYRLAGRCAHVVVANGSWTAGHLTRLWGGAPAVVFPPCDTRALEALPLLPQGGRQALVLSLAQFRPEKDHALQLRAFALLLAQWKAIAEPKPKRPRLVVAGAVRHAADQAVLDSLRELASSLRLTDDDVSFAPNLSLPDVHSLLSKASVGLHTMWNEHFGIGVVEMMAAGLAVVAHDSGGPAMDIIGHGRETGLLASTPREYADALDELLLRPESAATRATMATMARESVKSRFSEVAFSDAFLAELARAL